MSGNDYIYARPLARDSDQFELAMGVIDPAYVDALIVCLARQGYAPYYNDEEKKVCFEVARSELTAIKLNTAGDEL
jgi:hypothetical protein